MPFRYRLQKFLEIRIKRKEEQLQEVIKAQNEVIRIENLIEQNKQEILQIRSDMRKADPHMFERYDNYLKHLYEKGEKLEQEKEEAIKELEKQKEILKEREKEVNVLDKHKEHKKEEYLYEQKAAELKQLSEIGSQKHFRAQQEQKEESGED
ncbi:hypothetical protein IJC60_05555 [bacterium]|nr:hypothetical protein [bacterium]